MNFIEKIANYCLVNFTTKDFPDIAITALQEGIESESIIILAGMSSLDNSFELQQYFDRSIDELEMSLPTKYTSAQLLLRYYLDKMVKHPESAFKTMSIIDDEIFEQIDWKKELNINEIKYWGEELGLEKVYTWYRELQDFEDGDALLYYNELPRMQQKEKLQMNLIKEAIRLRANIDKEISLL
jgi:hypothetical protein